MNLHEGVTSEQQDGLKNKPSEQSGYSATVVSLQEDQTPSNTLSEWDEDFESLVLTTKDILSKVLQNQRESQSEQLHAQKMESIGQLAAGMAHEINTPLQYIGGNLDFIDQAFEELTHAVAVLMNTVEQGNDTPNGQNPLQNRKDKIDFILSRLPSAISQSRQGVENVSRIVRAMKGFSHPADKPVQADINDALESTFTVSKNEWKYVANIELNLDKALPKLSCIPSELNQVFLNIIVNAAHAIEKKTGGDSVDKGLISATTSFDSENIVVKIADTGIGMTAEVIERIFDPFFTTKEVGKGTGQGLSICRSIIVDRYCGKIDVQSELGKGTTFTIWLPREGMLDDDK